MSLAFQPLLLPKNITFLHQDRLRRLSQFEQMYEKEPKIYVLQFPGWITWPLEEL